MTLRIQCPSCDRQFKVSDDLKGRTVECGACEHRFRLDDGVIVEKRDKFYPGDQPKKGLDRYGRAPVAGGGAAPVQFETANYNQEFSAQDILPMSPQEWFASLVGVSVLVFAILLLIWGTTQPDGLLKDMEVPQRTVLAGFMVVVGIGLTGYGCRHRKKKGILLALPLGAVVIALSLTMPVPRTIIPVEGFAEEEGEEPRMPVMAPRKTAEQVREEIGFGPVLRAISRHTDKEGNPEDYVSVIWVPEMEELYKFQLLRYLQRKTGSEERPIFYRRGKGGIFVIDGERISLERVADIAERFGRVEEIYHPIRTVEVEVEPSRIGEASEDILRELTDNSHPAFYARNQTELDHIDLDRVQEAVQRLADVEPLRFRVEISRRLMGLLEEETDPALRADIGTALKVWSEEGDEAPEVVARVAREMQQQGDKLPRSMVEFLVQRGSPHAVDLLKPLWLTQPAAWEGLLVEVGPSAEPLALQHLESEDRGLQHSAIRILKRIGSADSVAALRAQLTAADDETKLLLEEVIRTLDGSS